MQVTCSRTGVYLYGFSCRCGLRKCKEELCREVKEYGSGCRLKKIWQKLKSLWADPASCQRGESADPSQNMGLEKASDLVRACKHETKLLFFLSNLVYISTVAIWNLTYFKEGNFEKVVVI